MKLTRRPLLMVGGVALAAILLGALIFAFAWPRSTVKPALILSNGQRVSLGESEDELIGTKGSALRLAKEGLYQYPGDIAEPVEVSINVEDNKVVGLYVSGEGNKEQQKNVGIGDHISQITPEASYALSSIDLSKDSVRRNGLKLVEDKSTTYYLTSTCGKGDRVVSIVLVLNGYDKPLQPFNQLPGCLRKGGMPPPNDSEVK